MTRVFEAAKAWTSGIGREPLNVPFRRKTCTSLPSSLTTKYLELFVKKMPSLLPN